MLPILLNEQFVHFFKFYLNQQLQQGMRYRTELYCLVSEFDRTDRNKAYQRACELAEQGISVVMTASHFKYAIWKSLKSAPVADPQPSHSSPGVCPV
ncbi:MAG: hypothetical protein SFW36_06820 [Leptolyngbyaceae cyanobacterium bins.59]|nr:hypothetical protein [Leptolyngbyaceae cyanobacterium bins.59]